MAVKKDKLLIRRLKEADVKIPGVGTIRVRGLSRAEAMEVRALAAQGTDVVEKATLVRGLVEPKLTAEEVDQWSEACAAGEFDPVVAKILELSGMIPGAAKEAYKEFEEDPDAEFHVPTR